MSEGKAWVDDVMVRLSGLGSRLARYVTTERYNAIYEAVSRGNAQQGRALVDAIEGMVEAAERCSDVPTQEELDNLRDAWEKLTQRSKEPYGNET